MVKRSNRNTRTRLKYAPKLFIAEHIGIATADTPSNDVIYTTSDVTPVSFRARRLLISIDAGGTDTNNWFVVRKVPQGYSNPDFEPATGTASLVDAPDVLGYAFVFCRAGATTTYEIPITWVRPTVTLHPGDNVILQGVPSTSSTGNEFSAFMEFGVCYL